MDDVPLVYIDLTWEVSIYNYAGPDEDPNAFEVATPSDDGDREPIPEEKLRQLYEALKVRFE